jgi:hypothetical protein
MIEADGRYFGMASHAGARYPAVSSNDIELGIDQGRNDKPECLNALSQLTSLLLTVQTGVSQIWLQLVDCSVNDFKTLLVKFWHFTH